MQVLSELTMPEKVLLVSNLLVDKVSVARLKHFEEYPGTDHDGEVYMAAAILELAPNKNYVTDILAEHDPALLHRMLVREAELWDYIRSNSTSKLN